MKEDSPTLGFLETWQKRLIGNALSVLAVAALVAIIVMAFQVLGGVVETFNKVIGPLLVSGILAVILRPVMVWIRKRFNMGAVGAVLVLYLILGIVLVGFLAVCFPPLVKQTISLFEFLPELIQNVWLGLKGRFPEAMETFEMWLGAENLKGNAEEVMEAVRAVVVSSMPALSKITSGIGDFIGWVAAVAIVPVYLFYLLNAKRGPMSRLEQELNRFKGDWGKDIFYLITEFIDILVAFFRGQLLIGMIMGVLLAAGFTVVGLEFGLVLGVVIGFLNIIPYLGTILGLVTVIPIAFLQNEGGWSLVLPVLAVFTLVQLLEGYFLTPKIMGKQTGLHPMVIIVSIFFWGTAFGGILGMILAVPLSAFLVVVWHLVSRKYLEV